MKPIYYTKLYKKQHIKATKQPIQLVVDMLLLKSIQLIIKDNNFLKVNVIFRTIKLDESRLLANKFTP